MDICLPSSPPRPCTAGPDLTRTHAHTACKKLRDRCLFMCLKEHMWTPIRVLSKDGQGREDTASFSTYLQPSLILCPPSLIVASPPYVPSAAGRGRSYPRYVLDPEVSVTASCSALARLMACFRSRLRKALICVPRHPKLAPPEALVPKGYSPSADAVCADALLGKNAYPKSLTVCTNHSGHVSKF